METLEHLVKGAASIIWGWPEAMPLMVVALLGTGLVTTFWLGWIQLRKLGHAWDVIRGRYDDPQDTGDISHFQALSTALSATVGIGNIAGVAIAIHYGGPGALFWMWVTALFGMALKFAECTLAVHYREVHPDGSVSGGPMYYIERGLGKSFKPLAIVFAVCAVISSFGSGNSVQAFTVADQFRADLGVATWITGLGSAALVGVVILGGIRRIGKVTSILAPLMALLYVTGALLILVFHAPEVPGALASIIGGAFRPAAQIGGFAGGAFITMLTWGVRRGLFSNESGQGSAPIAHAAAKTSEPVREGVVALAEPFIDTLLICSMTGLVIVTTGVWKEHRFEDNPVSPQLALTVVSADATLEVGGAVPAGGLWDGEVQVAEGRPQGVGLVRNHALMKETLLLDASGQPFAGRLGVTQGVPGPDWHALRLQGRAVQNGSPLTAWAFRRGLAPLGDWGHLLVTLAVFLFGISTAISWSYYGDRAIGYLFGQRLVLPYRLVYVAVNFLGAIFSLEVVWAFGDTALGLMALPNLLAILLLLPVVSALTRDYFTRMRARG